MAAHVNIKVTIYEASLIRNLRKHNFAKLQISIVNGQPVMIDLTESVKLNEPQALKDAEILKEQSESNHMVDDVDEYNDKVLNHGR